mmetsp:Transcript_66307/g.147352  ORF Transcript_66307/g.147352 Transcript_66307/m.147352 type:complete len:227 (+) Transcript_66307:292-972(+)
MAGTSPTHMELSPFTVVSGRECAAGIRQCHGCSWGRRIQVRRMPSWTGGVAKWHELPQLSSWSFLEPGRSWTTLRGVRHRHLQRHMGSDKLPHLCSRHRKWWGWRHFLHSGASPTCAGLRSRVEGRSASVSFFQCFCSNEALAGSHRRHQWSAHGGWAEVLHQPLKTSAASRRRGRHGLRLGTGGKTGLSPSRPHWIQRWRRRCLECNSRSTPTGGGSAWFCLGKS